MRVLAPAEVADPAVTAVLTSHMKPLLREALESVMAQTRLVDLHVVVVDSGLWHDRDDDISKEMARVFDDFAHLPQVEWVTTEEEPGLPARLCPVAWAFNEAVRMGLVRGRFMCTFYDDDRWHPTFVEKMAGALEADPDVRAVWCSQRRIWLHPDGREDVFGVIAATGPRHGAVNDCRVDGGQVMWRAELLDLIGDPWIPEAPSTCYHSDGLFLDKLGAVAGTIHPVPLILCDNRRTPISTFSPSVPRS